VFEGVALKDIKEKNDVVFSGVSPTLLVARHIVLSIE